MHVNFAPVVDVNSNPANPVIGSRSFGSSTDLAGILGSALGAYKTSRCSPRPSTSPATAMQTPTRIMPLPIIRHDRSRLDSIDSLHSER